MLIHITNVEGGGGTSVRTDGVLHGKGMGQSVVPSAN